MIGRWGMVACICLLILDMWTPFPTPMRGAYAGYWLLGIIGAYCVLLSSRRLPIDVAINALRSRNYQGRMHMYQFEDELAISPNGAKMLAEKLVKDGYIRLEGDDLAPTLVLLKKKDGSAYRSGGWVCKECIIDNDAESMYCDHCKKARGEVEAPSDGQA